MSTNIEIFKNIAVSLSQLVMINAFNILQSKEWAEKSNGEKILFLYRLNFNTDDITTLVGTTLGTVKKEISLRKNS